MPNKQLTKTQINAICDKLRREFDPSTVVAGIEACDMEEVNQKYVMKIIKDSKLPSVVKKYVLTDFEFGDAFDDMMSEQECKSIKLPYLPSDILKAADTPSIRDRHDKMIADLKFDLTMEGAESYKALVAKFQANVKKTFDALKPKTKKGRKSS